MRTVFLFLLLAPAVPAAAQVCTTQWTGATSSDFADPTNWTSDVPGPGAVGCIDGTGTSLVTHSPHAMLLAYGAVVVGGEDGEHTLRIDVPGVIAFEQLLVRLTGTFVADDGEFPGPIENDGLVQLPATGGVVLAEGGPDEGSTIVNRGRIEISAPPVTLYLEGTLVNEAGGTVALVAPSDSPAWLTSNDAYRFINRGLITSTGGGFGVSERNQVGHIEALSPGFVNEGGRIEVTDGELAISGSGGTRFEGGECATESGGVLRVVGGTPAELGGTFTGAAEGGGLIEFHLGTVEALSEPVIFDVGGNGLGFTAGTFDGGDWRNVGTVVLAATLNDATFTNEGLAGWVAVTSNNSTWLNESDAIIDVIGEGNFGGTAPGVVNRGLLVKRVGSGTSALAVPVANEAGGEIRAASGWLNFAALSDEPGATVSGTALLGVPGGYEPAGTIAPGGATPTGTLTWRFSETFGPVTVLDIDLAGPDAEPEYDRLVGFTGQSFVLGGTLRVRLADGYAPPVGTEFVVVEAFSISGDFADADLPGGLAYEVNEDNVTVRVVSPVGIEEAPGAVPEAFALGAAYPNPFREVAKMTLALPEARRVTAKAYDLLGREVSVLVDEPLGAGEYRLAFEAEALPSGVYLVRVTAGDFVAVRRVTLLR